MLNLGIWVLFAYHFLIISSFLGVNKLFFLKKTCNQFGGGLFMFVCGCNCINLGLLSALFSSKLSILASCIVCTVFASLIRNLPLIRRTIQKDGNREGY